jgi:hypothetical protein
MKWLVFSRNRTFQLDCFLRSAKQNAQINMKNVSVLYRYDFDFSESLEVLKLEYPDCTFINETNFREQTIEWVEKSTDTISFATDDALFTREVKSDFATEILRHNSEIFTVSLRLGMNLEWCYPTNQYQHIPNGNVSNSQLFVWDASQAQCDWGYPLSVDGHIYRKHEILKILKRTSFTNPNTLEANIQAMKPFIQHTSCCFLKSSYFNSPLNMVQSVFNNRSGQVSIEELEKVYRSGKRIDSSLIKNFHNLSAHQEVNLLEFCK